MISREKGSVLYEHFREGVCFTCDYDRVFIFVDKLRRCTVGAYESECNRFGGIGFYDCKGYDVSAVEYVQHNLEVLKSKIEDGMTIEAVQGDAVDLSEFADNTFDVTLVLGPLYHLYERDD